MYMFVTLFLSGKSFGFFFSMDVFFDGIYFYGIKVIHKCYVIARELKINK